MFVVYAATFAGCIIFLVEFINTFGKVRAVSAYTCSVSEWLSFTYLSISNGACGSVLAHFSGVQLLCDRLSK